MPNQKRRSNLTQTSHSLGELASSLDLNESALAVVEKNSSVQINAISEVENASEGDITFIALEKFLTNIEATRASVLIVSESLFFKIPESILSKKVVLKVKNAKLAFAKVSELFSQEKSVEPGVHTSAKIHPSVKIGKNAVIGPNCVLESDVSIGDNVVLLANVYLGRNVTIGADSKIFPNVVLYDYTELGKSVRVHANSVLGADGFGYEQEVLSGKLIHQKIHHMGRLIVGDNVEIGANTSIDRGTVENTIIGSHTKIDNQVQIGHNCKVGESVIICGCSGLAGSAQVGNNVFMGGDSTLHNRAKIGDGAIVASSTMIEGIVEAGDVWVGAKRSYPKAEYFRIQAVMSKLPEMYKFFRKLKRERSN